jgi:hypothetical protein
VISAFYEPQIHALGNKPTDWLGKNGSSGMKGNQIMYSLLAAEKAARVYGAK